MRSRSAWIHDMSAFLCRGAEHAVDAADRASPPLELRGELAFAGGSQAIKPGAPVVLGGAPFGDDPAAAQQALQDGIDRALLNGAHAVRQAIDSLGDTPSMHCAEAQRLE